MLFNPAEGSVWLYSDSCHWRTVLVSTGSVWARQCQVSPPSSSCFLLVIKARYISEIGSDRQSRSTRQTAAAICLCVSQKKKKISQVCLIPCPSPLCRTPRRVCQYACQVAAKKKQKNTGFLEHVGQPLQGTVNLCCRSSQRLHRHHHRHCLPLPLLHRWHLLIHVGLFAFCLVSISFSWL